MFFIFTFKYFILCLRTAADWERFLSRNGETGFTVQSLEEMKLSMKTGAPSVKMSNLLCFVWHFQAIKDGFVEVLFNIFFNGV